MATPILNCKINGAVKSIKNSYAKVNGIWCPINSAYKKKEMSGRVIAF